MTPNTNSKQTEFIMKLKSLTTWMIIGLITGIMIGFILNLLPNKEIVISYTGNISIITNIFLRLIKMIIAPLTISTLIVGITKMDDTKTFSRIFSKTLFIFIVSSFISITISLIIVNILRPGIGINLLTNNNAVQKNINFMNFSFQNFITHSVPINIIDAMSHNEIIQIVIFSIFVGCSLSSIGKKGEPIIKFMDSLVYVMLKLTNYIMVFAPITVFSVISTIIAEHGLGILINTSIFIGEFYFTLSLLWIILIGASGLIIGKCIFRLVKNILEPTLLAFTTSSSEAAFPCTLEKLEKFGVSNKIASFVIPIGYSFNLVGSMSYCSFAIIFIAQACNIHLSIMKQIMILFILMITSKGMAGIPRASLMIITSALTQFNIPESGLILLLGIDPFLDMGRSATNIMTNAISAVLVGRWEGEFYGEDCQKTPKDPTNFRKISLKY